MEAREEKLLRARASFRNEGSPKNFYEGRKEQTKKEEKEFVKTAKDNRGMFFGIRIFVSMVILLLFILADMSKDNSICEISEKSFAEIRKNELNLESYSALFSKLW